MASDQERCPSPSLEFQSQIGNGVNSGTRINQDIYSSTEEGVLRKCENGHGPGVRDGNQQSPDIDSVHGTNRSHRSKSSDKSTKRSLTPEEFDFETRYVVLNFLGLVPVSQQSLNTSSRTSSSEGHAPLNSQASVDSSKSGLERHKKAESGEWGALPKLPAMSIREKFREHDDIDYKMSSDIGADIVGAANKKRSPIRQRQSGETSDFFTERSRIGPISDSHMGERRVQVDVEDDTDSLPEPSQFLEQKCDDGALPPGRQEVDTVCDDSIVEDSRHLENGHSSPEKLPEFSESNGFDEVDALPWNDDVQNANYGATLKHNMAPPSAAQRPTSIDISKHMYPAPTPAAARPKSTGNKFQKSPLTKSLTIESEKSSVSSKPEYTWQYSRQSSGSSCSEIDSLMLSTRSQSSTRSVHIDVTSLDVNVVTPLVESKALPEHVIELKHEIDQQMHKLENMSGSSLQSVARSMSPESQIAAYLCQIGDRVQARHGELLDRAFQTVTSQQQEEVGYDELRNVADEMTQNVTGVTKVALLLLLGKRLTVNVLQTGNHGINKVVDYTAKLIEDQAADFIIEKGGWNSIKDIDDEWSEISVYDVEQGITPDNPDMMSPPIEGLANIHVTSTTVSMTSSAMTDSYHSDVTDTTIVADMKARDPSLDTLSSLNGVGEASPADSLDNVPFQQYTHKSKSSLDETSLSRHDSSSSARRGSFNFIPYPDHVLDSKKSNSLSSNTDLNGACGENIDSNNHILETQDSTQPSVFNDTETDFYACAEDCPDCEGEENCSQNYALVEGTLDIDISRDVMLLRQLSKELAEETEQARERQSYYNNMAVAVAILAVVVIGGIYFYRKK